MTYSRKPFRGLAEPADDWDASVRDDASSPREPAELVPYFQDGAPPTTNAEEAFLRVSVFSELKPSGSIAVYLSSGTRINVQCRDLLHFKACASGRTPQRTQARRQTDARRRGSE
jgi:hypothetical protein